VLSALGLVQDARSETLARALLTDDLGAALALASEVADDGLDLARFTRNTIDLLREALIQALRSPGSAASGEGLAALAAQAGTAKLTLAISELAKADFRPDPGSPIPLEVACAAALLATEQVLTAPAGATPAGVRPDAAVTAARVGAPGRGPASPEERFLRNLSERCRLVNVQAGALLNGQCEVVELGGDEVVLGFYLPVLKAKVEAFLPLVTEKTQEILDRPVSVRLAMIERAAPRRPARGGHLAEAARAMGATPVSRGGAANGQE
jgi:hypothetical protein